MAEYEYKIGDRVRFINGTFEDEQYHDATGTVTRVPTPGHNYSLPYKVEFDGIDEPGDGLPVSADEIELYDEGEATDETQVNFMYEPWPGGEWINAWSEEQAVHLRSGGFPVKKITKRVVTTTEYLS